MFAIASWLFQAPLPLAAILLVAPPLHCHFVIGGLQEISTLSTDPRWKVWELRLYLIPLLYYSGNCSNLHFDGTFTCTALLIIRLLSLYDNDLFVFHNFSLLLFFLACHILECPSGIAQEVINTIGQAFELRFKQYLKNPSTLIASNERSAWCWEIMGIYMLFACRSQGSCSVSLSLYISTVPYLVIHQESIMSGLGTLRPGSQMRLFSLSGPRTHCFL